MVMVNPALTRQIEKVINSDAVLRELFSTREPNWRFFSTGRDFGQSAKRGFPMFAWETERGSDGKYHSWVWQPKGDGWDRKKPVAHSKRKTAKARALRMRDAYQQSREGNR